MRRRRAADRAAVNWLAPPDFDAAKPGFRLETPPDDRDNPFEVHRRVDVLLTRLPDHHRIGRVQEVSGELGVEVDLDPAQPADARLHAKPKASAEARAGWHTGFSSCTREP